MTPEPTSHPKKASYCPLLKNSFNITVQSALWNISMQFLNAMVVGSLEVS